MCLRRSSSGSFQVKGLTGVALWRTRGSAGNVHVTYVWVDCPGIMCSAVMVNSSAGPGETGVPNKDGRCAFSIKILSTVVRTVVLLLLSCIPTMIGGFQNCSMYTLASRYVHAERIEEP